MQHGPEVLYAEERRERIVQLVRERRKVSVSELCELFQVTAATVRTDLRLIEEGGLITRTHGGAILRTHTAYETVARNRSAERSEQKRRIARAAMGLIEDGDTLLLDTGSTTLELARLLGARTRLKVLTNDLEIARVLEELDGGEVLLLGGAVRRGFHCTVAFPAVLIQSYAVDKVFLGANGFSPERGATTPDLQQAEAKRAMMAMSNQKILLCDSSKIGRVAFACFAPTEALDTLVTERMDPENAAKLRERGVELVLAR